MDFKLFWWKLERRCVAMFGSSDSAREYARKHRLPDTGLLKRKEYRQDGKVVTDWQPVEM